MAKVSPETLGIPSADRRGRSRTARARRRAPTSTAALFWIALGAAIVVASWRMDRLEHLGVNSCTAPGLMPGILGVADRCLRRWCSRRARCATDALGSARSDRRCCLDRGTLRRVGAHAAAVRCGFAVGLVGHGLPFGRRRRCFLFAHIAVFS